MSDAKTQQEMKKKQDINFAKNNKKAYEKKLTEYEKSENSYKGKLESLEEDIEIFNKKISELQENQKLWGGQKVIYKNYSETIYSDSMQGKYVNKSVEVIELILKKYDEHFSHITEALQYRNRILLVLENKQKDYTNKLAEIGRQITVCETQIKHANTVINS